MVEYRPWRLTWLPRVPEISYTRFSFCVWCVCTDGAVFAGKGMFMPFPVEVFSG